MKFNKTQRLLRRSDFDVVFEAAHTNARTRKGIFHFNPFIIYRAPRQGEASRLGITIAKRVIRRAHDRNRIKRCVREFFRLNFDRFDGDYVIRVVGRPKVLAYAELTAAIDQMLSVTSRVAQKNKPAEQE